MLDQPVTTPVAPRSVRVFCGYGLPSLGRDGFFRELGTTFMPGTPYMLAPLGLAAYVAAALDPAEGSGLPDEVALIVYASRAAYDARNSTLQGRMYTHSHAGVFDMRRSRGQFPGPVDAPDRLEGSDRWSWFLFDRAVDWQAGETRVVVLRRAGAARPLREALLEASAGATGALGAVGVDQLIVVATSDYAVVWLHGTTAAAADVAAAGLVPPGAEVARDLVAQPAPMPTGGETFPIAGATAYSFRFVRDLRYFL